MKRTKIPKLFADFTKITIPDGLNFAELKLTRDPVTGEVEFECAPLEAICEANGRDRRRTVSCPRITWQVNTERFYFSRPTMCATSAKAA